MDEMIEEGLRSRILPIQLMIFDVDGVLTDGRIIYHEDGSEIKAFDVQDGHGIKMLQRAGMDIALVTGRQSRAVDHRARGLGIVRVFQGFHRKIEAYEAILRETGLADEQLGCMGDDLIDIPLMRRVGFAVAVPNSVPEVLPFAHYVTKAYGGHGACREVCDLLLRVQGHWDEVTRRYFGPLQSA